MFVRLIVAITVAALYCLAPTAAQAQCTGQFGPGWLCGNPTGVQGLPRGAPLSSFLSFLPIYPASSFNILPGNSAATNSTNIATGLSTISAAGGGVLSFSCGNYQFSAPIDNRYSQVLVSGPSDAYATFHDGGTPSYCVTITPTFAGTVLRHRTPYNGPAQAVNTGGGFTFLRVVGNGAATRLLEVDSVRNGTYKLYLEDSVGAEAAYFTSGVTGTDVAEAADIQHANIELYIRQFATGAAQSANAVVFNGSSNANFSFNEHVYIYAQVVNGDAVRCVSADNNDLYVTAVVAGAGKTFVAYGPTASIPVGCDSNNIKRITGVGAITAQGTNTGGVTAGVTNLITVLDTGNGTPQPTAGTGSYWQWTEALTNANSNINGVSGLFLNTRTPAIVKAQRLAMGAETLRIYNNTSGEPVVLTDGATTRALRAKLTSNTTYYIRTDGNNTFCTGLTDAAYVSGSYPQNCAFLTWQAAANILTTIDTAGLNVILKAGEEGSPKTFATSGVTITNVVGGGRVFIRPSTSGTTITGTDNVFRLYNTLTEVYLGGVRLSSNSGYGNVVVEGLSVLLPDGAGGPIWNGASGIGQGNIWCHDNSSIVLWINGTETITGSSTYHLIANNGCTVFYENMTTTLSSAVTMSAFVAASGAGVLQSTGVTFVNPGNVTGNIRFSATFNGIVNTLGNGVNYFPGSFAGIASSGGQYADSVMVQVGVPVLNGTNAATYCNLDCRLQTFKGDVSGSVAPSGYVGERITASGNAVAITSGVQTNITSVSLTAGHWRCDGDFYTAPAGTTTQSLVAAGISTTTASLPSVGRIQLPYVAPAGNTVAGAVPAAYFVLIAPTTVYLVGFDSYAVSTLTISGDINCIRYW